MSGFSGHTASLAASTHLLALSSPPGLSGILRLLLQELSLFYSRDVNGLYLLYDLLHSPWLQALLKVSAEPLALSGWQKPCLGLFRLLEKRAKSVGLCICFFKVKLHRLCFAYF